MCRGTPRHSARAAINVTFIVQRNVTGQPPAPGNSRTRARARAPDSGRFVRCPCYEARSRLVKVKSHEKWRVDARAIGAFIDWTIKRVCDAVSSRFYCTFYGGSRPHGSCTARVARDFRRERVEELSGSILPRLRRASSKLVNITRI